MIPGLQERTPPSPDLQIEDPAITAFFGDGLVRKDLDSSYTRYCNQCHKVPIHKSNTSEMCPNCHGEVAAGRQPLKARA
jgi:DnaJ-class molecular chaperone